MPTDYTSLLAQGNFAQSFGQGLHLGNTLHDLGARDEREALAMQQSQIKLQQDQAELQQQEAYRKDVETVLGNPTEEGYRRLQLAYPKQHEAVGAGWKNYSEGEQRRNIEGATAVYGALANGQTDLALTTLKQRKQALASSGTATAETDALIEMIESGDPQQVKKAQGLAGYVLSSAMGDKGIDIIKRLDPEATALQKNYEYFQSINRPDLAEQYIKNQADPVHWVTSNEADGSQRLIPTRAGAAVGQPARAGIVSGATIEQTALATVPGAIVTSRQRSPAKNASVDGKDNSFHLTDQARDFVPPQGMTMGALAAKLKTAFPGFDVINEGNHVHVEPSTRVASLPAGFQLD